MLVTTFCLFHIIRSMIFEHRVIKPTKIYRPHELKLGDVVDPIASNENLPNKSSVYVMGSLMSASEGNQLDEELQSLAADVYGESNLLLQETCTVPLCLWLLQVQTYLFLQMLLFRAMATKVMYLLGKLRRISTVPIDCMSGLFTLHETMACW